MTLFELTGQWLQLLDMAEDPDTDEEALAGSLEAIGGEIEDKADGYAKVIRQLTAEAEACKAEADRLTARRRTYENRVEFLKRRLQAAMQTTGKTKFKTTLFSFGIQKNPAALQIDEGAEVPGEFLIEQAPKVDSAAIKEALKNGAEFEWARLVQSESLRIR